MPTDPEILGFSNQWYGPAIATAATVALDSSATLKAATPVMLAATKLCAWRGREGGDCCAASTSTPCWRWSADAPNWSTSLTRPPEQVGAYVRVVGANRISTTRSIAHSPAGYGRTTNERVQIIIRRIDTIVS